MFSLLGSRIILRQTTHLHPRLASTMDSKLGAYLSSIGIIDTKLQQDLVQSVEKTLGSEITVAKMSDAFTKADLVELSNALQQKQKGRKKAPRPQRKVVLQIDGRESTLNWKFGDSLLSLAQSSQGQQVLEEGRNQMEGSCGAQMSCSTCHVYLDEKTYQSLPPPTEQELDMLDLAFEPKETSRLGCQVKFDNTLKECTNEEHPIVVTIPSGVNDNWEG